MLLLPAALCLAQEDTSGTNEPASGFGGIPALAQVDSPSRNVGSAQLQYPHRFQAGQHTCATRVLDGDVEMEVEDGLDPALRAQGYRLLCVGRARGPVTLEA